MSSNFGLISAQSGVIPARCNDDADCKDSELVCDNSGNCIYKGLITEKTEAVSESGFLHVLASGGAPVPNLFAYSMQYDLEEENPGLRKIAIMRGPEVIAASVGGFFTGAGQAFGFYMTGGSYGAFHGGKETATRRSVSNQKNS